MSKSGFSLVELLVATMIASILGTLLFSAFYQINRFVFAIDNRTSIIEKAALVNSQLEKDFAGIIVPNEFYDRQPKSKERPSSDAGAKKNDVQKKEDEARKKQEEADAEQKKKKPLEKIFYSINKNGMLDALSFLTTSSLQVYWGPKSGTAKPRIVRVLYLLKENPIGKDGKKNFSLMRKESPKLEYEDVQNSLEYLLADNIKSLTMDYTAVLIEPEKKLAANQNPGQNTAKPEIEIKQVSEWQQGKPQNEEVDKNQKQMPLVPQVISMDISFWDENKRRSFPFVFTYKVLGEFTLKKSVDDIAGKMLGTLKEMFGHITPAQNKPMQVAHQPQSPFTFGQGRR